MSPTTNHHLKPKSASSLYFTKKPSTPSPRRRTSNNQVQRISRFFPGFGSSSYSHTPSHFQRLCSTVTTASGPNKTRKDEGVALHETIMHNLLDPGFDFYFGTFTILHRLLFRLRPVLIQESIAEDPWKLLIATMLLNKTAGRASVPLFWRLMSIYPNPSSLASANPVELEALLRPLGLQKQRARRLIHFSAQYLAQPPSLSTLHPSRGTIPLVSASPILYLTNTTENGEDDQVDPEFKFDQARYPPTPISHLVGVGPYALDSYRIYCFPDEWQAVMPTDKELIRYLRWKWAYEKLKRWVPGVGVVADIDVPYLLRLITELQESSS